MYKSKHSNPQFTWWVSEVADKMTKHYFKSMYGLHEIRSEGIIKLTKNIPVDSFYFY